MHDRQLGNVKMPLELKTGRSSFSAEHKGQVTLYSMMMNQWQPNSGSDENTANYTKLKNSNPGGLLLYLKDGCAVQHIPAGHNEKQGLVQLRNEMVRFLTSPTSTLENGEIIESKLPPPIDRESHCRACPLRIECTLYQVRSVKESSWVTFVLSIC